MAGKHQALPLEREEEASDTYCLTANGAYNEGWWKGNQAPLVPTSSSTQPPNAPIFEFLVFPTYWVRIPGKPEICLFRAWAYKCLK